MRSEDKDPRKVGGRYFCGYWQQEYTVRDLWRGDGGVWWLTVEWADGTTTTHCTPWDSRRDREVRPPVRPAWLYGGSDCASGLR